MQVLTETEVRGLIDRIGPHIDSRYDHTYPPEFPKDRTDVCVVKRLAENGNDYGFDTLWLVWKKSDSSLAYREIANSSATKDYLHIDSIEAYEHAITVRYFTGGSFSGKPTERTIDINISQ